MKYTLKADMFLLELEPTVFEKDIALPINTLLQVHIKTDSFEAFSAMDISRNDLIGFAQNLKSLYDSLAGNASIKEPYGARRYINLGSCGRGYISVSGKLFNDNRNGSDYTISFRSRVDQTCLASFANALYADFGR